VFQVACAKVFEAINGISRVYVSPLPCRTGEGLGVRAAPTPAELPALRTPASPTALG